jgi:hypothetical protein
MVNLSMSRSAARAPLLFTVTLALAAGAAPLAAQSADVVVRRSVRTAASDSSERELKRLERRIDSLARVFETDDLTASDRSRIGRTIDALIAQFKAQRMRLDGASTITIDGPYVKRTPEPSFGERPGVDVRTMFPPKIPQEAMARGWIGIVVSGAPREVTFERNEMKMRFLSYPEISSVDPSSPAQRAGLAAGDTLLAYDGQDVRGAEISMTRLLRPNSKVVIRVRRDGRIKELPVVVAEAPSGIKRRRGDEFRDAGQSWFYSTPPEVAPTPPPAPRPYFPSVPPSMPPTPAPASVMLPRSPDFPPMGVAGAQLVTISDGLKKSLGLQSGVLVATVPRGTPADESGLKEGDVIVRVARQPVRTVVQVWQIVTRVAEDGEREVDLDLIRLKQTRTLKLRW